ncbi:MAG: response regulator transcription factor [Filimonas sp.]|nr:response regulator transcription factor [Filimonas sp.]
MKVLIIEDEPLGADRLAKLLHEIAPDIEVLEILDGIQSSVEWFRQHAAPDIVFMDIELSDGQCFEIFKQVDILCPIIFTTSYDEYALQAFQVNSIDYLLKPVKKDVLQNSLKKYATLKDNFGGGNPDINKLVSLLQERTYSGRSRFLVKSGQRFHSVEVGEIAYFYGISKLCFLVTWSNKKYMLDYTLDELQKMVNVVDFYRANRSYIVHARAVKDVVPYFNGKLKLNLAPEAENEILVSREKAIEFKMFLGK